ncbi:hypothetical protein [Methylicorpusculum sp.]|uniref:hypothetical protein n=1 Tax=Methylicorpusculum sp. TaxID=2713644 RepID=UPI0027311945|nr:hypothetical protein [Methylicorpusculum sp.]MDP2178494.1 hypothetical protein [Methylicorpusculum sp.]MDP3530323.1 hypothetical protein [Methylicorpusculum sp.]MDZ4152139.1 hypothetical protein [Methylicorpusculum sp.]
MKERITDIFLRRLDSYINPKIENRVIYGALISGVSLLLAPKILALISGISIKSESYEINIKNSQLDDFIIVFGFILILLSVLTLYIFRIHKRPEFVIESDSPSARLWKEYGYSFQHQTLINPLLLKDLVGWISDSGRQIASIDIAGSNSSNRYFGEVLVQEIKGRIFVEVQEEEGRETFGYEYLGTSESGIHVLHAYDRTGGSATFHWILLLQIEESSVLVYEDESAVKTEKTPVLKLVGRLSLGDRYIGNVSVERGVIHISKDDSHLPEHLINSSKNIVVK